MPHCTAPVLQTGDKESRPVATPTLLHRVTTTIVDFFLPAPLRSEYCVISTTLTNNYYSCLCLFLVLVFAIAEFEQPGWFPRPEELSSAVVGTFSSLLMTFYRIKALTKKTGWVPWCGSYYIHCCRTARVRRNTHLAMGGRWIRMAMGGTTMGWYCVQ